MTVPLDARLLWRHGEGSAVSLFNGDNNMPNWCANRLRVSGKAEDVEQALGLVRGGGRPTYGKAIRQGIGFFMAGCAGLLRPVSTVDYAPYPGLTSAGAGENTAENRAFTAWLNRLQAGCLLTEEACASLNELWLNVVGGLPDWSALTDAQRDAMSTLWKRQRSGWPEAFGAADVVAAWDAVRGAEDCGAASPPLDMLVLCPPRLEVEINGFNGWLLSGVPSGHEDYVERYGTKWPEAYDLNVSWQDTAVFDADFDTPWSPPSEAVLAALSARFDVTVDHFYAESGCDYCGFAAYSVGEQTEACSDSLEWSEEEDEDGFREVTGPDWIVDNVAHYGG